MILTDISEQVQLDYLVLYEIEIDQYPALSPIFNRNEASHLTICPACGIDDFTHVEGCVLIIEYKKTIRNHGSIAEYLFAMRRK